MIIGSEFCKKHKQFLIEVGSLSLGDTNRQLSVQKINANLEWDRIEIKNVLEYLQELDLITIETIGGPLLYGHITITDSGLKKYQQLINQS